MMEGVEIFIAMLPTSHLIYNAMSNSFYRCLAEDNLLDECSTIIARIVDDCTSHPDYDINFILKKSRLDSENFKDRLRKYLNYCTNAPIEENTNTSKVYISFMYLSVWGHNFLIRDFKRMRARAVLPLRMTLHTVDSVVPQLGNASHFTWHDIFSCLRNHCRPQRESW